MSSFVGIDYDSNGIYIAFVDEDTGELLGTERADLACGPGDSLSRAGRVRDLLPPRHAWIDIGVVAIGIELPFSRQRNSIVALSRVQGAILACLPRDERLPIHALTPNGRAPLGWKALTVGKTNASKPEIKAWALANGAPDGLLQDFYDAFAIARATARLYANRRQPAASTKGEQ